MAKPVYKNYQLHRTLPKLSGNMQLDLILDIDNDENVGYVKQAHIRPISKYIGYVPVVDERIMDRPHHLNIKRFYEKTRSGFFDQPYDPRLKSDWPLMISDAEMSDIKYIKQFDDTYFAGCQRMSYGLYGCTHEILIPMWLEQCAGLLFEIHIRNKTSLSKDLGNERVIKINLFNKTTKCGFHNDFIKYLLEYFDYTGISVGSNQVMTVNFSTGASFISGLEVKSGNCITCQNSNLLKNLLSRERPLLESNSIITNTFMDYGMITTQLVNFNLCLNFSGLNTNVVRDEVWVTAKYMDSTNKQWVNMEQADFFTNHHYLPRMRIINGQPTYTYVDDVDESNIPRNVLDYKKDYMCTDLMHKNKMSQSICHWGYVDETGEKTFNVYDGFGAYIESESKIATEYKHGIGIMPDVHSSAYDEALNNIAWCGGVNNIIGVGGFEGTFQSIEFTNISKTNLKFHLGTTDDISKFNIAIGVLNGNEFPSSGSGPNYPGGIQTIAIQTNVDDIFGKIADMDNRYAVYINDGANQKNLYYNPDNPTEFGWYTVGDKNHENMSQIGDEPGIPNYENRRKPEMRGLFIAYRKTNSGLDIIFIAKNNDKFKPDELTIRSIQNILKKYVAKYQIMRDIIDNAAARNPGEVIECLNDVPNLNILKSILNLLTHIEVPATIYFDKSIVPRPDTTLAVSAHEHNYYKCDNNDSYVWRYSGAIKPMICQNIVHRSLTDDQIASDTNGTLVFSGYCGRNFLWHKKPIFLSCQPIPANFLKYISRNIAPCYPSLNYDPVVPMIVNGVVDGDVIKTPHGDLMYDEIPPLYLGWFLDDTGTPFKLDNVDNLPQSSNAYVLHKNEYNTYEWAEFKWFNRSHIMKFPESVELKITSLTNDKETIKTRAIDGLVGKFNNELIDKALLLMLYDFSYDLQNITTNNPKSLHYNYKVTAKLK